MVFEPQVVGINHVAVSVPDLEQALDFYHRVLGLPVLATQPAIEHIEGLATVVGYDQSDLSGAWALIEIGAGRLELVSYRFPHGGPEEAPRRPADIGLAHLALLVDDVDAMHSRLTDQGFATISGPVTLGRHRAFYAYGPAGELLEFLEEYSPVPPNPLGGR